MGEVFSKLGINGPLLISQIVNFALMLFILQRLLYKPILNMLEQRREKITQSLKEAESVGTAALEAEQEKAAILDQARREAQEIRAQATRDTEKIAQDIRARADQEAVDIHARALADAQTQKDNALADVNKQVADLAIQATEKLLGRELENKTEQRRFVTEFIQQGGS